MKTIAIIKYIFILVGVGMLLGAFFLYKNTNTFLDEATKVEGTVVDLMLSKSDDSAVYKPVVNFISLKGEKIEFVSSSGSNPPGYAKGERVEVFYLPAQPQNAKINGYFSLWGGSTILAVLGCAFFFIGAGIIVATALKGRKDEYLKAQGTPITTEFQSVEHNLALSVNGKHPFHVVTQWLNPATSEVHVFKSNNLWYDPSDYIKGKTITVFIEKANPKKYYVDLSFLPRKSK